MLIVDLSANNERPLSWDALQGAKVTGAVVKATQGTTYVSPVFGIDYRAAKARALYAGAYHFDQWLDPLTPQLQWFSEHYGPVAGDLPPWWDLEDYRLPSGRMAVLGVDLAWPGVIERMKTVLWCLRAHYGDGVIYADRDTAGHLIAGGFSAAADLCVAQGSPGPVMAARIMQLAPVSIPGNPGLIDWSVA